MTSTEQRLLLIIKMLYLKERNKMNQWEPTELSDTKKDLLESCPEIVSKWFEDIFKKIEDEIITSIVKKHTSTWPVNEIMQTINDGANIHHLELCYQMSKDCLEDRIKRNEYYFEKERSTQ